MKKRLMGLSLLVGSSLFFYSNCSQSGFASVSGGAGDQSLLGPFGTSLPITGQEANVMPVTVGCPNANFNAPCVSVRICQPGTINCVTVDNMLLDTGDVGVRVFSSFVSSLHLNQEIDSSG